MSGFFLFLKKKKIQQIKTGQWLNGLLHGLFLILFLIAPLHPSTISSS